MGGAPSGGAAGSGTPRFVKSTHQQFGNRFIGGDPSFPNSPSFHFERNFENPTVAFDKFRVGEILDSIQHTRDAYNRGGEEGVKQRLFEMRRRAAVGPDGELGLDIPHAVDSQGNRIEHTAVGTLAPGAQQFGELFDESKHAGGRKFTDPSKIFQTLIPFVDNNFLQPQVRIDEFNRLFKEGGSAAIEKEFPGLIVPKDLRIDAPDAPTNATTDSNPSSGGSAGQRREATPATPAPGTGQAGQVETLSAEEAEARRKAQLGAAGTSASTDTLLGSPTLLGS